MLSKSHNKNNHINDTINSCEHWLLGTNICITGDKNVQLKTSV